ncbi:cytochrome c oxidase subunit 2 [Seinonella peptonophila]|uniref:Cytochrome c oxidase subunit 2 n=1 Tax=Seinonella peptonophila TaxID=112248 RepID=A0A1M4ZJ88_9BACL|nr:cytochrome c oxidase subunit II [Seinonella peptonophila]SHF17872.1 cytochrome c oxidase subunit 2 [Seinonella peptonophila]
MSQQRTWRLLFIFATVILALAGCSGDPRLNVLTPKGTAGEIQLDLIKWSLILMVVVFAIVLAIYVYVLIRFRKRKGIDRMPKQVHGSTFLEILWTVVPIICLVVLAFPTVRYTFDLADKPKGDALEVKVTGYQYWWEFEYPQLGIKTAQELVIPTGRKVHFEIKGKDVLHSFWVPALGGKTDVVPGRVNYMWLDAKKPGLYQGKCAELCGAGHALMDFKVYAKNPSDFNQWVTAMKQPATKTVTKDLAEGEKLFRQNCMGCHAGVNPSIKGPELTHFGLRDTIAGTLPKNEANLKKWLKDPSAIKPGTKMPKIDYLNDQEMNALTQYLMTRKPESTKK